jgi:beta-glucosidase
MLSAAMAALLAGCGEGGSNGNHKESRNEERVRPRVQRDIRTATTPKPRGGPWAQYFHRKILSEPRPENVRVVFVGDSITHGWRDVGWRVWHREYAPLGAVNLGVPADQTQHILWRLEHGELEGLRPEVFVVMAGTNNLLSGWTRMAPRATAAGVEAIVDLLREKRPDADVLLLGILPRQPELDWMPAAIEQTNKRLRRMAEGRKGVHFLDIGDRFLAEDGKASSELLGDLLHPSEAGYRVWADAMRPTLRRLLDEPPASPASATAPDRRRLEETP